MSSPADTLSQMIEALTEEPRKARRRTYANTAYKALSQLREAQPPANAEEAERRGYEAGLLAAMELARLVQRELDEPLRKAVYANAAPGATGAIDALRRYADTVVTQFEIRATRALHPPEKEAP